MHGIRTSTPLLSPLLLLALLVGVIPAMVIASLMWVSAYRQMTGTHVRRERAASVEHSRPAG